MIDPSPLTCENLESQFCSDFVKNEIKRANSPRTTRTSRRRADLERTEEER